MLHIDGRRHPWFALVPEARATPVPPPVVTKTASSRSRRKTGLGRWPKTTPWVSRSPEGTDHVSNRLRTFHLFATVEAKKRARRLASPSPWCESSCALPQVEAIEMHDLRPGGDEVVHECRLGICTRVDFRQRAQL